MNEQYDFDYWLELYKKDPEEFCRQRDEIIKEELCKFLENDQEKIARLFAKIYNINTRLDRIHNPIERFNQLQVIFWKQFVEFHEALKSFSTTLNKINKENKKSHIQLIYKNDKDK